MVTLQLTIRNYNLYLTIPGYRHHWPGDAREGPEHVGDAQLLEVVLKVALPLEGVGPRDEGHLALTGKKNWSFSADRIV